MKHYHLQASPHNTGVYNSSCRSITVSATNENNNPNGINTTNTSSNDKSNNYSDDKRDSAYWSIGSIGDASKREYMLSLVTLSCPLLCFQSIQHTNIQCPIDTSVTSAHMSNPISSPMGAYHHDKPTPILNSAPIRSLVSPASNNGMSVASLVSPTTTTSSSGNMDERMLGMLNRGQSDASARSSYVSTDSRRDSIDNRSINTAINDMKLNPAPIPFPNNIPSTTSIQAALQSQRDPRNGPERLSASRFPSGPSGIDLSKRSGPRTAPAITGVTPSQYANNPTPIVGQAWAGFDVDDHARAAPSIAGSSRHTSYMDSRRGSIAESFASTASQMTTESSLPHGQRRLGDPYSNNYMGRDHGSIDANTHHHQLKNKQLEDIRDEDGGSPGIGVQPYSRTPELRVSHKLAERKRRDEMKTLYDTLRELMPQERGNKASKWEILSKGELTVSYSAHFD